jgi:uncharacterized membrane protein YdjX (TVP38/TMEM64 family)
MRIPITEHFNAIGIIVTLAIIGVLAFFVDLDALKEAVLSAGPLAPLLFIALKTLTVVMVPLSGAPLYPVAGAFFGFVPGVVYMVIGDLIGYTIAFFLARTLGAKFVDKLLSSDEDSLLKRIVEHISTVKGFLHTCLTLGVVPELIAYASGLSKIRYPIFIAGMSCVTLLGSTALVFIGATFSTKEALTSGFLLPIAVFGVIAIGGSLFYRSVRTRKPTDSL